MMKIRMSNTISGDLSIRASVDTNQMDWSPSPSGTVWRKRVHLVGPAESGQVTSVVRYEPNSTFLAHDHPDGEEILVLGGVFSDEHGNWPTGTYLLNPEGFRHAPFSKDGCMLFVKLRQFQGRQRHHIALDANVLSWQTGTRSGVEVKPLYQQDGFLDTMRLERWAPDSVLGSLHYPTGAEYFVLDGRFTDESGNYEPGAWLRLPAGCNHQPRTTIGCILYIKEGGLAYLRAEANQRD